MYTLVYVQGWHLHSAVLNFAPEMPTLPHPSPCPACTLTPGASILVSPASETKSFSPLYYLLIPYNWGCLCGDEVRGKREKLNRDIPLCSLHDKHPFPHFLWPERRFFSQCFRCPHSHPHWDFLAYALAHRSPFSWSSSQKKDASFNVAAA